MYLILAIKILTWGLGYQEFQATEERKMANFFSLPESSPKTRVSLGGYHGERP